MRLPVAESWLTRRVSREMRREAVLSFKTPFRTPRLISGSASRSALCAASASPPATAISTFLMYSS